MKTQLLLYDFPAILFQMFLKNLGIIKIQKFMYEHEGDLLECKYALLPKTSENEHPVLVLMDARNCDSAHVQVSVLNYLPTIHNEKLVSSLQNYPSIIAKNPSSSGHMSMGNKNGSKKWLSLISKYPCSGEIDITDDPCVITNQYYLEISKLTFALYANPEYDWVTCFFDSKSGNEFLEIRGKEIVKNEIPVSGA